VHFRQGMVWQAGHERYSSLVLPSTSVGREGGSGAVQPCMMLMTKTSSTSSSLTTD
jgi:hypothetical protein